MNADQNIEKMPTPQKPRALLMLLIGVSLTAAIVAMTFRFASRYAEQDDLVRHTYQVKLALRQTLGLLDDAETGQSGYLLTGESQYLELYRTAVPQIEDALKVFADLTKDNPAQQKNAVEIRRLTDRKFQELRQTIDLYQAGKQEKVHQIVPSNIGKQHMNAIREVEAQAESEEDRRLAIRTTSPDREKWLAISLALAILPISLAVYFTFLRFAQAAVKSESTLHGILSNIGDAVIVTNKQGMVTHLNPVAEELTGWQNSDAVGSPMEGVFRIVSEQSRRAVENPVARVMAQGHVVGLANHTVLISRDGRERSIDDRAAPIRDDRGHITGAVRVFRDIGERRLADEALEKDEQPFRTLANSIPQLAWMAHADGHIFWYNDRWYEYTGKTPQEMEGWGWQAVHDPKMLPSVLEMWKASIRKAEPLDMEFPLRRADGVFRWFLTRVIPIRDPEGRVLRWFGTNTDINDSKQAEQILQQRVEERTAAVRRLSTTLLQSQDAEKRKIARELHDSVGQYLAHIKMSVEAMKRPDATEKEVKALSHVIETLDKCLAETRTLAHLLHPPLLDEVGFRSAARLYLEGFSERSGIRSNINMPTEPGRMIANHATELALFRVLQESLTNVHRYSETPSVDVELKFIGDEVTLEVRDYGKGIPQESLQRFKTTGEGSGVGLNSMRERIRELGGSFEVQSSKKGTLIRASIPLSAASAKTAMDGECEVR